MDIDRILPNLFIGSCPEHLGDIDGLKPDFGVTAVLSVQTDDELNYWGIRWEELQNRYQQSGVEFRRMPVRDFDVDDLRRMLPKCVAVLDELLRAGHTVFLHCNAGVNRSPTIAIAFLYWIEGWALEEATTHVMRHHASAPFTEAIRLADGDRNEGQQDVQ